jgi:hypothetical protein
MARYFSLLSLSIRSLEHFSKDQTLNRGNHLPGAGAVSQPWISSSNPSRDGTCLPNLRGEGEGE